MTSPSHRHRIADYALLMLGVVAASSSVLFIKGSEGEIPVTVLASGRLLLAAAMLTPVWAVMLRRQGEWRWRDLRIALPGAVFLAIHFVTWIMGVRMTSAASATLIVNLSPVLMPFAVWIVMRERIVAGEIVGSLVAIAGVLVLSLSKGGEGASWQGDAMCAFSLIFVVAYLVCARVWAHGRSIWLYVVPLYWMAGLISLPLALPELDDAVWNWHGVAMLVGLALVPTVIGHSITNIAMTRLPTQTVSTINLSQFISAAAMAYVLLGEVPQPAFYVAAVLVVAGALIVVRSATPQVRRSLDEAAATETG